LTDRSFYTISLKPGSQKCCPMSRVVALHSFGSIENIKKRGHFYLIHPPAWCTALKTWVLGFDSMSVTRVCWPPVQGGQVLLVINHGNILPGKVQLS
jgi:hypothetical protein